MPRAPRKGAAPKEPALNGAPDVIGDAGRAKIVADLLASVQSDRFKTDAMRVGNGHDMTDPCPQAVNDDGSPMTYESRLKQLDTAITRLVESHADLMPRVKELLGQE